MRDTTTVEKLPREKRQCGPTLMLSLLLVIVLAFLALSLFNQGTGISARKPAGHSVPETLPTK